MGLHFAKWLIIMENNPLKHPSLERVVMIRMEFGYDTFFERLRQGVAQGDPDVYLELDRVVERSVAGMVAHKIPVSDREDVMQEIKLTVYRNLVKFLKRSADYSPAQRNAWLRLVAKSRINDYYRKNYLFLPPDQDASALPKFQSMDDEDVRLIASPFTPEHGLLNKSHNNENQDLCDRLIAYICGLRLSPERIVAFFYNAILIPLSANDSRKKGDPTWVVRNFSGRPLEELVRELKRDLSQFFGRDIPDWVFSPLEEKLDACPPQAFQMNEREISVLSSRTRTNLRQHRETILGGICDE